LVISQGRTEFIIRVDKPIKCHVFLKTPEESLLLKKFLITIILRFFSSDHQACFPWTLDVETVDNEITLT
jgi:hypothetical protein